MKMRFTYKDFILLLGIMVAMVIAITTIFYRDSLLSIRPTMTKKIQVSYNATVLQKGYHQLMGKV